MMMMMEPIEQIVSEALQSKRNGHDACEAQV